MKFDLIISNPPYNNGKHLQILEQVLDLSDNIIFLHPSGWLFDNKLKSYVSIREKVNTRLLSIELFNGYDLFDISVFSPISISIFGKNNDNQIKVIDKSKWFSNINREFTVKNIFDIDQYAWYDGYAAIKKKILNYCKNVGNVDQFQSNDKIFKFDLSPMAIGCDLNRAPKMECFYVPVKPDYHKHCIGKYSLKFSFNTENERKNFYLYLRTKFVRFCLSIFKNSQNIHRGELASVPYFGDFSKSWNDYECAKEIGLSNKELMWIKQQILNFYENEKSNF